MTTLKGHLVDIIGERIYDTEITVNGSRIESISPVSELPEDAPYIMPGFIDSHIHIESTLLQPEHFARVAVTHGTVGVVTDPHEIANVLGVPGIEYMVANAASVRFHFKFGIPSCVPSTTFETAGACITADDVRSLLPRDEFFGLAEMMNYPGVLFGDPEVIAKIEATLACGKLVDGHSPGLSTEEARKYIAAGISTDHEMYDAAQARERIGMGMKVLIREGSAGCNFDALSPLLMDDSLRGMLMFCTDDIYCSELIHGHIDRLVARAVAQGVPLWNALHAACVAPVRHYSLDIGLLEEGGPADFILVDDLVGFKVSATYISGLPVFSDGRLTPTINLPGTAVSSDAALPNVFRAEPIGTEDISVAVKGERIKCMTAVNKELLTGVETVEPKIVNGMAVSDPERDILKIVVYNRYSPAVPAVAFIKGFGLREGALASSIAHDSHNIIAVGVSDEDIVGAVNELVACHGGISVVNGEERTTFPLPLAGLMSDRSADEAASAYLEVSERIAALGCQMKAPLMTMSFMALPVIPSLKLTDKGLFDVEKFAPTDLFC